MHWEEDVCEGVAIPIATWCLLCFFYRVLAVWDCSGTKFVYIYSTFFAARVMMHCRIDQ